MGVFILPGQLTTSRIGNIPWLIHTLLYIYCDAIRAFFIVFGHFSSILQHARFVPIIVDRRKKVDEKSCVTPAGTSNELDVQNEWEENTQTW